MENTPVQKNQNEISKKPHNPLFIITIIVISLIAIFITQKNNAEKNTLPEDSTAVKEQNEKTTTLIEDPQAIQDGKGYPPIQTN